MAINAVLLLVIAGVAVSFEVRAQKMEAAMEKAQQQLQESVRRLNNR